MSEPIEHRYSRELSREFWDRVNALIGEDHAEAYALGVALQNLEEQVLKHLNEATARSQAANDEGK